MVSTVPPGTASTAVARQNARCVAVVRQTHRRSAVRQAIALPAAGQRAARQNRHQSATFKCRASAPDATEAAPDTVSDTARSAEAEAAMARLFADRRARMQAAIPAGPPDDPPSYEAIDAAPHNRLFMHLFRQAVVQGLGEDAPEPG